MAANLGNVVGQLTQRVAEITGRANNIVDQHGIMTGIVQNVLVRLQTIRGNIQQYIVAQGQVGQLHQNIQTLNDRLQGCTDAFNRAERELIRVQTENDDLQHVREDYLAIVQEHEAAVQGIDDALREITAANAQLMPLEQLGTALDGIIAELDTIEAAIAANPPQPGPQGGPGAGPQGGPGAGPQGGPGAGNVVNAGNFGAAPLNPNAPPPPPVPNAPPIPPNPPNDPPDDDDDEDGAAMRRMFGNEGGRRRTRKGGYRYGTKSRRSKTRVKSKSKSKSKSKTRKSKSKSKTRKSKN